ncbi:hypothetical protein BC834DRAFT_905119 [Gloeopeniophorella convolvens]|nr:hypothetical protein BC834DRAFT_905119 [Gloeopeniophorella convolvens]
MSPMGGSNTNSKKLPSHGDSSPSVGMSRCPRNWYAEGVSATPGHGKSHHHLGPHGAMWRSGTRMRSGAKRSQEGVGQVKGPQGKRAA